MFFHYLFFATITFNRNVLTVDVNKLFYEKDLSEFCKRRVIPSIFLGRHVVEASSFILHFTKLNLPYSCFISVRSESGSNIIMVITLPFDAGLDESCSGNSPQLLVHEMGETFGGYWGMLPEVMLSQEPPKAKFYTLKSTQPTTEAAEPSTEEYIKTTTSSPTTYADTKETEDFIQVEVPIVDVSGRLVPGSEQPTMAFDIEEAFDYQYDVTPIPGVKYDTSILPLVQLSVRKQADDVRRGQEPRYELDIVEDFTPDSRLGLPKLKATLHNQKQRVNLNRRLKFGKSRTTKSQFHKKFRMITTKNNRYQNKQYIFPSTIISNKEHTSSPARGSWEIIDKLIETLNKNKEHGNIRKDNKNHNTSKIAENISNMKHNFSIYLKPNLSIYNEVKSSDSLFATKQTIDPLRPRATVNPFSTLIHTNTETTLDNEKHVSKSTGAVSLHSDKINTTKQNTSTVTSSLANLITSINESFSVRNVVTGIDSQRNVTITEKSSEARTIEFPNETAPPVSLVDHESWENIVQAAPGMAVLLNQTVPYNDVNKSDGWSSLNETYRKELLERRKRAIQSISIENDRPRNLTTRRISSTTKMRAFNVADMQEFARLVELQDDDMHGRVSLRYMKQYLGPAIYNICGDAQPFNRHVYLFNTSRIVLSLNNFTLSKISVIITGARTLLTGEMRCPMSQLECQVSGARVCVDSLAACDGVPNCGSYDIYDEDRLMCGVALGLQHNVYLAAFTFLALLLTLFYAVHYWLKRCVPKVAEAFFVYTEGVENFLYLDSIMHPPGDFDNASKMVYRGNMGQMLSEQFVHVSKKSLCSRLFRKCFICFRKTKEKEEGETEEEHEIFDFEHIKKTYSYTQMELSNMLAKPTVDTSVQTGESLEMTIFSNQSDLQIMRNIKTSVLNLDVKDESAVKTKSPPIMIKDSLLTLDEPLPEDELNLMKFLKDSRSDSSESISVTERYQTPNLHFATGAPPGGEKELSSIMYDGGIKTKPGSSGVKTEPKATSKASSIRKRIRFQEGTTMILSQHISEDDDHEQEQQGPSGQTRSWRSQHLSTIKEDDESGSKHRHFWESKGKKSTKKKANLR